ncbi:MAG: nuclear transport factor 2 family protein [Acidimicrobiia bacterium]
MKRFDEFLDMWLRAERSGDAETTAWLLTDDFVGIGPLGFQLPKTAWVGRFAGGLHYDGLDLDEVATRFHGNCSITTARWNAKGTSQGRPIPEAARVTLVGVDVDGWKVAAVHLSFIAGTPGAPAMGPS